MKYSIFALLGIIASLGIIPAYGHTTVTVEPYDIEAGWGIEPPVVGFRNHFVFEVTEPGEQEGVKRGVLNAFKNLEATAKFGGITKKLDVNSEAQPGHYFSDVIPTKTGSFSVILKGDIDGVPVDIEIPIEDVEGTAVLDFPPTSGSSSDQDVAILKNAISSLQKDVSDLKSGETTVEVSSGGDAYNFAVLGLSLGAAGVILAIIAMIKRK